MKIPTTVAMGVVACACGAAVAWSARPSEEDITVRLVALPEAVRGAREPALLDGGRVLRWWQAGEFVGLQRVGEEWKPLDEPGAPTPAADQSAAEGRLDWETVAGTDTTERLRGRSFVALRNGTLHKEGRLHGWAPDVAVDAGGGAHLVYDRATDGDFDVVHRDPLGAETVIAGSRRLEAHPSVAVDARGRTWIAWDEGVEAWGSVSGLHQERRLRLVVHDEGEWREVELPDVRALVSSEGDPIGSSVARFAELPRLVADASGGLWLFYRVMQSFSTPPGSSARRAVWVIRATALGQNGWAVPVTLPYSAGPNHDTLAVVALPGGGALAAWTGDGRRGRLGAASRWNHPLPGPSRLRVAELAAELGEPSIEGHAPGAWRLPAPDGEERAPRVVPPDPAPELVAEGYQRLWGDVHRHSDLSRCAMDVDGSVVDQYRYARAVAGLDFMALTEHHQHVTPDLWEFSLAAAERYHEDPEFLALYGFERALPGSHHNLLTDDRGAAADAPMRPHEERGLKAFATAKFVAVPHQIADPGLDFDWKDRDPDLEPVIEIFQRRGAYESLDGPRHTVHAVDPARHAWAHLSSGERFGFIASSDHAYSGSAFAAVLVRERSRAAVLDALRARRCYAATALMALDVSLDALIMGEAGRVREDAGLRVRLHAGAEIARVEVVRNGRVAQRWAGRPGEGRGDALLTLHHAKGWPDLQVVVAAAGVRLGDAHSFDAEPGDRAEIATEPSGEQVARLFNAALQGGSVDGWILRLDEVPGSAAPAVRLTEPVVAGPWTLERLRSGPVAVDLGRKARAELRLDPPPLGGERFDHTWSPGDWAAGDWVYVRVVRTDGEVAWSSPIWVDAVARD